MRSCFKDKKYAADIPVEATFQSVGRVANLEVIARSRQAQCDPEVKGALIEHFWGEGSSCKDSERRYVPNE